MPRIAWAAVLPVLLVLALGGRLGCGLPRQMRCSQVSLINPSFEEVHAAHGHMSGTQSRAEPASSIFGWSMPNSSESGHGSRAGVYSGSLAAATHGKHVAFSGHRQAVITQRTDYRLASRDVVELQVDVIASAAEDEDERAFGYEVGLWVDFNDNAEYDDAELLTSEILVEEMPGGSVRTVVLSDLIETGSSPVGHHIGIFLRNPSRGATMFDNVSLSINCQDSAIRA